MVRIGLVRTRLINGPDRPGDRTDRGRCRAPLAVSLFPGATEPTEAGRLHDRRNALSVFSAPDGRSREPGGSLGVGESVVGWINLGSLGDAIDWQLQLSYVLAGPAHVA